MNVCRHLSVTGLLALGAVSTAFAAAPRFGFQASVVTPLGSLKRVNSNNGLAIAATLEIPIEGNQSIRPRLEFSVQPSQTESYGYYGSSDYTSRNTYLGADFILRPMSGSRGVYAFVGLGACKTVLSVKDKYPDGYTEKTDLVNHTRLAYSSGLGYTLNNNWGFEAKVTQSDTDNVSITWAEVGATFRF
jgi:hypothetical protein